MHWYLLLTQFATVHTQVRSNMEYTGVQQIGTVSPQISLSKTTLLMLHKSTSWYDQSHYLGQVSFAPSSSWGRWVSLGFLKHQQYQPCTNLPLEGELCQKSTPSAWVFVVSPLVRLNGRISQIWCAENWTKPMMPLKTSLPRTPILPKTLKETYVVSKAVYCGKAVI